MMRNRTPWALQQGSASIKPEAGWLALYRKDTRQSTEQHVTSNRNHPADSGGLGGGGAAAPIAGVMALASLNYRLEGNPSGPWRIQMRSPC